MTQLNLQQAVQHLQQGEVLAYPTEAVWGLGCDPYQHTAFQKLLALKQRPIEKGVILISHQIECVQPLLTQLDYDRQQQIIQSWQIDPSQRATTWLLPVHASIPAWIYGQHDCVAVRVTQHPTSRALCEQLGHFLVSTSANPATQTPATDLAMLQGYFPQCAYLQGELGNSPQPSRIIDARTGQVIRA